MTGEPLIYAAPPKLDVPSNDLCTHDLGKRKRDLLENSGPRKRLKLIRWKELRRVFPKGGTNAEPIPCDR